MNYLPTDIVDPKLELGQGPELYETWIYYVLDNANSYIFNINDPDDIVTFRHMGNPFQVGMGAGGKDASLFSASGWMYWNRGKRSGYGDVNIDLGFECPPVIVDCDEAEEDELFTATSSTTNGNVIHSLWMPDLFDAGTARFDFTEGQLRHNDNGASLYGTLNLSSGGGALNGTSWGLKGNF